MTYVTEQTSSELRAHMHRLKAMSGWHEPLADRLFKEVLQQDAEIERLRTALASRLQEKEGQPALSELLRKARSAIRWLTFGEKDADGFPPRVSDVLCAIDATLAAGSQAVQVPGWRPIETAPKDGRIVLYWVASVRFQEDDETGKIREVDVSAADFGCWMPAGGHGDGYHDPFGGIPGDQGGATHWMPVPAAPIQPLAGGEVRHD